MQRVLPVVDVGRTVGKRQQDDIQSGGRRRQERQLCEVQLSLKQRWRCQTL